MLLMWSIWNNSYLNCYCTLHVFYTLQHIIIFTITVIYLSSQKDVFLKILLTKIVFSEVKKKEDDL